MNEKWHSSLSVKIFPQAHGNFPKKSWGRGRCSWRVVYHGTFIKLILFCENCLFLLPPLFWLNPLLLLTFIQNHFHGAEEPAWIPHSVELTVGKFKQNSFARIPFSIVDIQFHVRKSVILVGYVIGGYWSPWTKLSKHNQIMKNWVKENSYLGQYWKYLPTPFFNLPLTEVFPV